MNYSDCQLGSSSALQGRLATRELKDMGTTSYDTDYDTDYHIDGEFILGNPAVKLVVMNRCRFESQYKRRVY